MDTVKNIIAWMGAWANTNPIPATIIVALIILAIFSGMIYGAQHDGYAALIALYQAVTSSK